MTRKDYRAIAAMLANVDAGTREMPVNGVDVLSQVFLGLCTIFKQDNPNFKPEVFRQACGL
jgi:hypothetical protein